MGFNYKIHFFTPTPTHIYIYIPGAIQYGQLNEELEELLFLLLWLLLLVLVLLLLLLMLIVVGEGFERLRVSGFEVEGGGVPDIEDDLKIGQSNNNNNRINSE